MKPVIVAVTLFMSIQQSHANSKTDCVAFIKSKGYSSSALPACLEIDTNDEVQLDCLSFIINSNYSPNVVAEVCPGISRSTLNCVKAGVRSGHSPRGMLERCQGRR